VEGGKRRSGERCFCVEEEGKRNRQVTKRVLTAKKEFKDIKCPG